MSRGKFARICMEIDLTTSVVRRVCIEGKWNKIKYEGLHIICAQCGCYGHDTRDCLNLRKEGNTPVGISIVEDKNPSVLNFQDFEILKNPHGDWLVVARKPRNHNHGDPKGKGNLIEKDLKAIESRNIFDNLINKDTEDVNVLGESTIMHENSNKEAHVGGCKSCEVSKESKWRHIVVKKKVVSLI